MKTYIKKARKAILAGDLEEARKLVYDAQRMIDKVASKGVIHKREAARRKSRIMGMLAKAEKSMAQTQE
jgi:small subunit ribosomal protein S20